MKMVGLSSALCPVNSGWSLFSLFYNLANVNPSYNPQARAERGTAVGRFALYCSIKNNTWLRV